MKKSVKWMIGLAVASFICVITACILFFTTIDVKDIESDILNNKGTIISTNYIQEIDEEKQISLENNDIDLIEIEIDFGDVKIVESEDEVFRASMKGKLINLSLSSSGHKLDLITEGKTLKFEVSLGWTFFGFGNFFVGDIILQVPKNYQGGFSIDIGSGKADVSIKNEFDVFKLDISSGKVDIDDIKCKQSYIEVSSGTVNIKKLKAENSNLEVGSGVLTINNFEADSNLVLDVSSGLLTINNCVASNVTLDIGSGVLNLFNGNFKTLDADISSGLANIEANEVKGDYTIEISSGIFKLKLSENASYKMSGHISSGSLKNNKTGNRYTGNFDTGSGEFAIRFNISSGYAEIN